MSSTVYQISQTTYRICIVRKARPTTSLPTTNAVYSSPPPPTTSATAFSHQAQPPSTKRTPHRNQRVRRADLSPCTHTICPLRPPSCCPRDTHYPNRKKSRESAQIKSSHLSASQHRHHKDCRKSCCLLCRALLRSHSLAFCPLMVMTHTRTHAHTHRGHAFSTDPAPGKTQRTVRLFHRSEEEKSKRSEGGRGRYGALLPSHPSNIPKINK